MSLPKRDGVNDRYYLIHKPDTFRSVLAEADLCIQDVLNGTARENHSAYPTVAVSYTHLGTGQSLLQKAQILLGLLLRHHAQGFVQIGNDLFTDVYKRQPFRCMQRTGMAGCGTVFDRP